MRLDTLPKSSAIIIDMTGEIQFTKLEDLMPKWKVAVLQLLMPERWRQMRQDWGDRYLDAVQEDIYAKLSVTRKRVRVAAENPARVYEMAA
jgi:hypothetical protein